MEGGDDKKPQEQATQEVAADKKLYLDEPTGEMVSKKYDHCNVT